MRREASTGGDHVCDINARSMVSFSGALALFITTVTSQLITSAVSVRESRGLATDVTACTGHRSLTSVRFVTGPGCCHVSCCHVSCCHVSRLQTTVMTESSICLVRTSSGTARPATGTRTRSCTWSTSPRPRTARASARTTRSAGSGATPAVTRASAGCTGSVTSSLLTTARRAAWPGPSGQTWTTAARSPELGSRSSQT